MPRIVLLIGFCFFLASGSAQGITPTFAFTPDTEEELQQHFTSLLFQEGCTVDTLSGVLLSIRTSPVQYGLIDGMKRLHTAAFSLFVEARVSGSAKVISSQVGKVQSTGSSQEIARQNALRQLQSGSTRISRLMERLAADYQKAFAGTCHTLLADAAKLVDDGKLREALALTAVVPSDADCYVFARKQRDNYYARYQQEFCAVHLEAARSQIALQMPKAALEELGKIGPDSPCVEEAREALEEAAALLQDQQSTKAQFLRQVYQNQIRVEEARNQIVSDLVREKS